MIWFWVCDWVLIWVEIMGSDGSNSGCGWWWRECGSGGGFRFCSGFLMMGF